MLLRLATLTVKQKFAGDNFQRYSGEATNMQKLQMFAWQSNQRGHNVHIQANPTAGELLHREFNQKKEVMKGTSKVSILEKYGGEQHLERLPRELLAGQTEECMLCLSLQMCSCGPRLMIQISSTLGRVRY